LPEPDLDDQYLREEMAASRLRSAFSSTVTIENTYRLLGEEKMPLPRATLHGAAEIALPTLVSTIAISCVFTSVVFLEGPAKYLFTRTSVTAGPAP
jgi:multidrug efflux pump subunit AcrB